MSNAQIEKNKQLIERFFSELMTLTPNLSLLEEMVREDYVQHNPLALQGREGLRHFVVNVFPKLIAETKAMESPLLGVTVVAEDDLVVRQEIHADWMLVDIFRIQDGWLVEHWDAFRPEPHYERWKGF